MSSSDVGVALAGEPGIAPERAQALRQAFQAMIEDKAFQDDAARLKLDLEPLSGEGLTGIMTEMANLPDHIVDRARDLLRSD